MTRTRLFGWAVLWTVVCATACFAQNPAGFISKLSAQGQQLKGFEATMTTQAFTAGGPLTTVEKVTFAAPNQLRVETMGGDVEEVNRQVTVCSGSQSFVFTPATRRLLRWQENLVDKWVREAGGPANVANFGTTFNRVSNDYNVSGAAGQRLRDRPTYVLTLTEKNPVRFSVNDFVRTGGGSGYPLYFNVYKRSVTVQPPRVVLTFDAERGVLLRREHYDDKQRLRTSAEATEVKEIAAGVWFPVVFQTKDQSGQAIARVSYDVKVLNAAPSPTLFTLLPLPDTIAEDATLKTIADYRRDAQQNPDDPSAHYNLALALWRHTQNLDAAIEEIKKVVQLRPQAVVPHLAAADVLIVGRRYQEALGVYEEAQKIAPHYPGLHAAKGFLAQRTYRLQAAVAEFELAVKEQPKNVGWQVLLGELYQQQGNYDSAQKWYESALRAPAPTQTAAKLAAASNLRLLTIWLDRVQPTLQATANDTSPFIQKLRGDLLLHQKKLDAARAAFERAKAQSPDNFSLALSIAVALDQAGDIPTAQREYEALAKLGTQSIIGVNAMRGVISLHALAGRHEEAWKIFQTLHAAIDSETERNEERRLLLESYRKRFRLDDLMKFLESKLTERPAREEAYRTLLDLYDYYQQSPKARNLVAQAATTFPASGFWRMRQCDTLVLEAVSAGSQTDSDKALKDRKFRDARQLVEDVIRADPEQFYYRAQLVYVVNRARFYILDPARQAQWKRDITTLAQQLVTQFPNDPDALTVATTIEFDQAGSSPTTAATRYQQALEMGRPIATRFDEAYFIRQMLAQIALSRRDVSAGVKQYTTMFDAAPTVTREIATGATFLTILVQVAKDNPGIVDQIVNFFLYIMREPNAKPDKDLLLSSFMEGIAPQEKPDGTTANAEVRQQVADAIKQKLKQSNADPYLHHLLGRIYAAENKADEALSAYEKAAEALPHDPDLASWTGDGYLQQARRADVEERALRQQNKTNEATVKAREKEAKYHTAIEWYRKALQLNPSRIDDYYWIAVAHWGLREINQPSIIARDMMLHVPNDFRALTTLAKLYFDVGRSAQAVDAARDALTQGITDRAVSSDEVIALSLGLASALAQEGQFSEAVQTLRQINQPQCGTVNRLQALFNLATLYADYLNRKPQAIETLREALQLTQSNARRVEILFSIAQLQASTGKKADAEKTLREALALNPPGEVKKAIENAIKELQGGTGG